MTRSDGRLRYLPGRFLPQTSWRARVRQHFLEYKMPRSSEYVICPHCNAQHGDCWEWAKNERPETMMCSECSKEFRYWAEFDVQYVSMKIAERVAT
jgi:hypothetical protein